MQMLFCGKKAGCCYNGCVDNEISAALAPSCRMRQADCPASVGAEWKEEIEADFKKRHQE